MNGQGSFGAWIRRGRVTAVLRERPGFQELAVTVEVADGDGVGGEGRAWAFPPLLGGRLEPGQAVWLNVTAVRLGLGSGGRHLVVSTDPPRLQQGPPAGHIVKLRYTPWQQAVLACEEEAGPAHHLLRDPAATLAGMPVVAGELHSQLLPVLLGARRAGARRIAYVMTDGGALPAALSETAAELRRMGWLEAVITAGHAFGGDLEAVALPSALLAARWAVGAELAVVLMGPGIVGTGTAFGFTGVEQAWALQVAAALGGVPVAALRVGQGDPRPRHRGLSHHSRTVLGRLVPGPVWVALPRPSPLEPPPELLRRHAWVEVGVAELDAALEASPLPLRSMGRGVDQERPLFRFAAAAGFLGGWLAAFSGAA
ncbi:MAG: DUF3866 family protein [Bacillota bacterium]|nr:DUF3866 family protein [Bacillota bacterium]